MHQRSANIDRPALDSTVPALVLKVGTYPLHHGGLGVVRSLGRLGVPVYGVYEEHLAPAAVSRYLTGRFVWRSRPLGGERFLDRMAVIGERLGRRAVLIPTDDLGAILISEHAPALDRWFRFPLPPPGLAQLVASKKGLFELCGKLGVPCPRACFPLSRQDVEEFAARASFPVVAKVVEAWLLPAGAGVRSTTIVHDPESLRKLYQCLEGRPTGNLMLQEYIPRGSGQDWFFHGYCDARSECLASFTGVKLRSYPAYAGPTTLGRCQDNEVLRASAEELLHAISYCGIMDLDYRLDLRDGEYKLLDFNPRVGAQFRLFEDEAAVDVVRALHLDLTDRPVTKRPQAEGRMFIVEHSDLLASLDYARAGDLDLRSWLSSLRGTHRERAWFARDDPAPFLLMCVRFLLRGLRRALGLQRRRSRAASTQRRSTILGLLLVLLLGACTGSGEPEPRPPAPASTTASPAPMRDGTLKPIGAGLYFTEDPQPGFGAVDHAVIGGAWADFEPRPGDFSGPGWDRVDTALRDQPGYRFRLRILAGRGAPDWAKRLGGSCVPVEAPESQIPSCVPRFWTDAFLDAYGRFMAEVARRYDREPRILDVVNSACTTTWAEPFIRTGRNRVANLALWDGGLNPASDRHCFERSMQDMDRAFRSTRISLATHQAWQLVVGPEGAPSGMRPSWPKERALLNELRSRYGTKLVVQNNGLGGDEGCPPGEQPLEGAGSMWCWLATLPPPKGFQTEGTRKLETRGFTVLDAARQGIAMRGCFVENNQFGDDPAAAAELDRQLKANCPGAS